MKKNNFSKYLISNEILEALTMLSYVDPTPIQEQVIPLALEGRDIVGKSQTGSGKTAAFAIPLCENVDWMKKAPQAIVLEPTRELAVQVSNEIFNIGRKKRLKVPSIFGGFPIDKQITTLKQKNHIIVGTPGRVLDHLRRETLHLSECEYLVIDEADLMLQMGFIDEVEDIISQLPEKRITMLFSATMGEPINHLVEKYMKNPTFVTIETETETVDTIEQFGYLIDDQDDKYELLMNILICENPESGIIFCGTREMVNVLFRKLKKDGVKCGMIHGMLDQQERLRTIEEFAEGRFRYLIATDVAARGVDFDNITIVINYDFPTDKENYVHRIGRTGRKGRVGKAVSLIQKDEKGFQAAAEEYGGVLLTMCQAPTKEEVSTHRLAFRNSQKERAVLKEQKGAIFNRNITKLHIGGGAKSKMRAADIVGTICSVDGVTSEDIGVIDVRDSFTLVEILNGKGSQVLETLQKKTIKGKVRKVRKYR